jgi:predicted RNase H-like HicB family nuclease
MTSVKVIVERHDDGYVAYPIGLKGVCVAEGDSFEEALREIQSAIRFHLEAFGWDALRDEPEVREVFVGEALVGAA